MLTVVLSVLDWDITKRHVECLTSTCVYCDMQNYKMDVIKKIVVAYPTQAWSKGMFGIFRRRLRKLWMDRSSQRLQRRLHSDSSEGISLEENTDCAGSFSVTNKKFLGAVCDSEGAGLCVGPLVHRMLFFQNLCNGTCLLIVLLLLVTQVSSWKGI